VFSTGYIYSFQLFVDEAGQKEHTRVCTVPD